MEDATGLGGGPQWSNFWLVFEPSCLALIGKRRLLWGLVQEWSARWLLTSPRLAPVQELRWPPSAPPPCGLSVSSSPLLCSQTPKINADFSMNAFLYIYSISARRVRCRPTQKRHLPRRRCRHPGPPPSAGSPPRQLLRPACTILFLQIHSNAAFADDLRVIGVCYVLRGAASPGNRGRASPMAPPSRHSL